ncbi:MAG: polysaccharide deacetylase family protein [bacterium]
MKKISLNIDVDPIVNYYLIHGLESPNVESDPVYEQGVTRFLDLFEQHEIKATFFITAKGAGKEDKEIINEIVSRGHEIGNHSFSHDYALTQKNEDEIYKDILENHNVVKNITGFECTGFRSPGYNSSDKVVAALKKMNYIYDSSLFPSPSYYLAKWLLINFKKLLGHKSKSIISSFKDAFGSQKPEFIDKNIKNIKEIGDLIEIPITTLFPPFGVPLIGTSLVCFPEWVNNLMLKNSLKRDFINIELHGIDLVEINDSPLLEPLKKVQPDLKHPLTHKLQRVEQAIVLYKENGYKFMTLEEIAKQYF